MSKHTRWWGGVWVAFWLMAVGSNLEAVTKTWSGSGNWGDANWSPSAPVDGDEVIISSGSVTVNVETVHLSSFSNNATVVFSGWNSSLHATNVTVNATITHLVQSDTNGTYNSTNGWDSDSRVHIDCSNLTVLAGKVIDVDGKGFIGRLDTTGCGPGGSGSAGDTDNGGPGGSYGGKGGDGYAGTIANTYGETNAPVWPGSAGGHPGIQGSGAGGNGGGAVRIVASGTITLNGTISSKGLNGAANAGGGSGGGVYIDCRDLEGTNTITVAGGTAASYGGGGGGGRIAINYSGRLRDGGYSVAGGTGYRASNPGTYYTRATANALFVTGAPAEHGSPTPYTQAYTYSIPSSTVVTNSVNSPADAANGVAFNCIGWMATTGGVQVASGTTTQAVFTIQADTTLTFLWTNSYELAVSAATNGSVTAASNGWYVTGTTVDGLQATPDSGYQFIQWSGDVPSSMVTNNPLTVTLDQRRWIVAHFASTTAATSRTNAVGGDWFAWTNWSPKGIPGPGDSALLSAGTTTIANPTAFSNLTVASGATLQASGWDTLLAASGAVTVSGTVTHAVQSDTNGTYNSTNGWTPDARLYLSCASLTVATGGKIDANGKGYQGRYYTLPGAGPGGSNPGGNRAPGGSYGGKGGNSYDTTSANTYGSSNAPVDPGSAGGGYTASYNGKPGGGAIRIITSGDITVNGSMSADGTPNGADGPGSGSGGAIYLDCNRLKGSGTVSANGGTGTGYGGGGGGGRIAVYYSGAISLVNITVNGGITAMAGQSICSSGGNGTYVAQSTGVPLTIGAAPAQHGTPTPYGYGASSAPPGSTVTNSVNSPADQVGASRYACVGWQASTGGVVFASGGGTQAIFTATAATTLTYLWTNEYALAVATSTNGSVTTASNGWYLIGASVGGLQATPDSGFQFLQWSGDVPAANIKDNPLAVTLDRPRAITAHFTDPAVAVVRTNSAGGDWFAWTNWTPRGVPGPRDQVVLSGGAYTLVNPLWISNLTVNAGASVTVSGWDSLLIVSNDVTVAGTLTHTVQSDTNGTYNSTNGWTPDARVYIQCRSLNVPAGGKIDVSAKGYQGLAGATGCGPGGSQTANRGAGGSYGGLGGSSYDRAAASTYGSSNAPVDPGSAGGGYNAGRGMHGGGVVRIVASGDVQLDGAIAANGEGPSGTGVGCGSGGSVYIDCSRLLGSGWLCATGGVGTSTYSSGGGGGRIAVVYAGNISAQLNVSVAGGRSSNVGEGITTHGATGTYVTVSTGVPLTIGGDPAQHGTPTPLAYGNQSVSPGSTITNSVNSPADTSGGTRYASIGWVATTGGVVIASGATTTAVVTVTVPTVLMYRWTNEYLLAVQTSTNGTVSAPNGWYTDGATAGSIQATADSGYEFVQWSGDVPAANCRDNPLSLAMTQPRTIVAHFVSVGAGTTRSRASGGDWFAWTNWSPMGIPGPRDTAVLTAATTTVNLPVQLAGLVVFPSASLSAQGWSTLIEVSGDMVVSGLVTHAANTDSNGTRGVYGDWTPDARVYLKCRNLTVAPAARIDVAGKGYSGGIPNIHNDGCGPGGGQMGSHGAGGGYGGPGGRDYSAWAGGVTYGSSNAPADPGSGGGRQGAMSAGSGGGSVWIEAGYRVRVDGAISADGTNSLAAAGGGGSGGGIYIDCVHFEGNGTVRAAGGNGINAGGGGGGGRIAIRSVKTNLWTGSLSHPVSVTNGVPTGGDLGQSQPGVPGTLVWQLVPPSGAVFKFR